MHTSTLPAAGVDQRLSLLSTLEQLLAVPAIDVKTALDQVSDLVAATLAADKVDTFLYHPESDSLVAAGASDTPLAQRQKQLGLDRLPLSNGGAVGRPGLSARRPRRAAQPRRG